MNKTNSVLKDVLHELEETMKEKDLVIKMMVGKIPVSEEEEKKITQGEEQI